MVASMTVRRRGVSPMRWLADARIDRARALLETTNEPVANIGRLTGLGAPASVRATFHRHIGTSPQEYRSLFGHRTPERSARRGSGGGRGPARSAAPQE